MSEGKMKLGDVVSFLRAQDGAQRVEHGFGVARSWRGNYSEVAFRPEAGTTVTAMLMHAESAIGSVITGYKGGDYWVDEHTRCNVAEWGCYDETDGLTLERLRAMCGIQPELEQAKAERDRLAAEVVSLTGALREANALVAELIKANRREVENNTRLAESIFDHDCPSFSMCPKHIGSRELEECPYCMIERLTARWAALNVKLREVYLEGLDDTGPVAEGYADGVQAALHLMDALEREEAK